jgi:hypothetical protein
MPDDLQHKVLIMGEVQDNASQQFQNYCLRELMSEGKLIYRVTQKVDGEMQTIAKEINGPVAFMVSTTRNQLHPENETRMLSIELDDSPRQTKRVMAKVAEIEGLNRIQDFSATLAPWHDFQRWLAAGERRVHVPFAEVLAALIPAKAVRLRRDLGQVIRAVQAHALLRRPAQLRSGGGDECRSRRSDRTGRAETAPAPGLAPPVGGDGDPGGGANCFAPSTIAQRALRRAVSGVKVW